MSVLRLPAFVFLMSVCSNLWAQNKPIYNYEELSHLFYLKQKDSIKKAWECPVAYTDKATQKKYKEIWDSRTQFIKTAIENDDYIHDSQVFTYVEGIVDQIAKSNKELVSVKPFLLIDRSSAVNAYAVGGNIIVVNLGLVTFTKSREELALAIAHELSHNILRHAENAMKQRAELLTSDEYKNSLNDVLNSKYERLSRLKKILENYSFDRNRHQRYKESEADSLAIILLKKSRINFDPNFFLRLDSADNFYKQPLKTAVKNYFTAYNVPFEDAWTQKRSKGLSSRNYNFTDSSKIQDSLKTHPDCAERYAKTIHLVTPGLAFTPIPSPVVDNANKMIIWNLFSNMNLTACLYRIMLEKDKAKTDQWYDFMVHNIFNGLYYSDKELRRFKAIGVTQKEYISKNYYELQTMFEQIPRETLEQYCRSLYDLGFWKNMNTEEKALKTFMYTLALDPSFTEKNVSKVAKEFSANNPSSMYCEFAGIFETK